MNAQTDYYRVLGVSPSATATEIKTAYHRAAKRVHPDAGGSAEAMQLVNEAYAKLSDPQARRDYDTLRAAPVYRRPAAAEPPRAQAPSAPAHRPPSQPHPGPERSHRAHLNALARRSAWRIIGYNVVATILLGFVTSFMFNLATDRLSRVIIALVAFVPVYCVICGAIFLFQPRLRLALARLGVAKLPPRRDLGGLFLLGLSALPLAAIWLLGYFHNAFR